MKGGEHEIDALGQGVAHCVVCRPEVFFRDFMHIPGEGDAAPDRECGKGDNDAGGESQDYGTGSHVPVPFYVFLYGSRPFVTTVPYH